MSAEFPLAYYLVEIGGEYASKYSTFGYVEYKVENDFPFALFGFEIRYSPFMLSEEDFIFGCG